MNNVLIGKRITFGAIVGGLVSIFVWSWNLAHPGREIPAEMAVSMTTVFTGIGQVIIANKLGVTVK